jgi:hypothetical protein
MCVRELLKIETQVPEKSPTEEHGTYAAIWELPSFALAMSVATAFGFEI